MRGRSPGQGRKAGLSWEGPEGGRQCPGGRLAPAPSHWVEEEKAGDLQRSPPLEEMPCRVGSSPDPASVLLPAREAGSARMGWGHSGFAKGRWSRVDSMTVPQCTLPARHLAIQHTWTLPGTGCPTLLWQSAPFCIILSGSQFSNLRQS